jgi:hypothetical protein
MVIALAFLAALLVATVLKLRSARAMFHWVWDPAEPSLRGGLVLGALCAVGVAAWLSLEGLFPPAALALGAMLGTGVLVAAAGIFGVEGALLEPGSATLARRIARAPPPTSTRGRVVALLVGSGLASGAVWVLWWLG